MRFFKKNKPATVAEALAPFKAVQAGLAEVITTAQSRRKDAQAEISHAEAVARQVKREGGQVIATADAEEAEAKKVQDALAVIVGKA